MMIEDQEIENCEHCGAPMDVGSFAPYTNVECPECGAQMRVRADVGNYLLTKKQGIGGMSLVFSAVDKNLGREAAIKILNEDYSKDEKRIEMFELEARITAAISHPHIVKVFTVGQAFQRFYIAMELISGGSLEGRMVKEKKLPEMEVLKLAIQTADGLNAANQAGLIHRDIKPGNILYDKDGNVKIVDFGLALVTQGGTATAEEIWATPYYVPPEALEVQEEDFRGDIYALGATLYHALSGEPPFTTETRSTIELKKIKQNIPSLKEVAPWITDETCSVIDKAMAFDREERHDSYRELIGTLRFAEEALKHSIEGTVSVADTLVEEDEGKVKATTFRKALPAIIGASVVLIGGITFAIVSGGDDEANINPTSTDEGLGGSGDISKRVGIEIIKARASLRKGSLGNAVKIYSKIASDSKVPKDTAYWAGLQVMCIHWINDNGTEARDMLGKLMKISETEVKEGTKSATGKKFQGALQRLNGIEAIKPLDVPVITNEIDSVIAFASGLKNWSSGYVEEALALFEKSAKYKTSDPSEEYKLYQRMINNYKHDAKLVNDFRLDYYPGSFDDLEERVEELNKVEKLLKTKGRVRHDLEEWLSQCEIHEERLEQEEEAENLSSEEDDAALAEAAILRAEFNDRIRAMKTWAEFAVFVRNDLRKCEFGRVRGMASLTNFASKADRQRASELKYICGKAKSYKSTLRSSLGGKQRQAKITLRETQEVFQNIYNVKSIGVEIQKDGKKELITWAEIEPGNVVDLYRLTITNPKLRQSQKDMRLEQAICFAFLTGEIEKADHAARILASQNKKFRVSWKNRMAIMRRK